MSFPKYPGYKDSGVEWLGSIPAHWDCDRLSSVASCNDEVLPENTPIDYEIEYVEISGVEAGRGIVEVSAMPFGSAPSRARRVLRDGDILISTVRTYLRAIAQVNAPSDNMIASTGFAVLRPRSVASRYLGYACYAEGFVGEVIARSVGVSYPAINASELVGLKIPLPPSDEQAAIAAFLDRETAKIDALMAEQENLIGLLKEKRQAVISHAVTKGLDPSVPMKDSGVEWLGEVPAHWDVLRIKHLVASLEQGWSPQCEGFPVQSEDEWGVLKVGCVNGGVFRPEENKTLPPELEPLPELGLACGDLLISRANTRELVGSAAVALQDFPRLMLCDKLYRLRLRSDTCAPVYLAMYLGIPRVRGQIELSATGASSSMLNIGQSTILELDVAVPPPDEQTAIATFLDHETARIDALTAEAQSTITLLQERRTALISAAVTGQIDVRSHTS
jgi:type I restriction enzyme S subunit